MKPSTSSPLLAAINAERAALFDFVALLRREQSMLTENLTDQLLELSEQKSNAALSLNQLGEARRALLQKNTPQLDAVAIQDWLGTHSPTGLVAWREVLSLAAQAHQLNSINGELIQMKLRHNQQALAVLSNAVNKASLYGPNGQPDFSPGSGRSLGSG